MKKLLSEIEDQLNVRRTLGKIAANASKLAIEEAHRKGWSVTYRKNGQIISEAPDGSITVISKSVKPRRKVKIGDTTRIQIR